MRLSWSLLGKWELLAKALTKVLTDQALTQGLIEAGTKRVAEFSMERLAGVYVEKYERAIAIEKQILNEGAGAVS